MEIESARPEKWFLAELTALVLSALFWTIWIWPTPFSDFRLYWEEAGGTVAYERGGVGVLLLAIARRVSGQPQWAALIVNLPAAVFLLWLMWRCDTTQRRLFAHLGAICLLLIAPYFGMVQIDFVAATCLAICFTLLLRPSARWLCGLGYGAALLIGIAAVSTRPQFALTLGVLSGILVLLWLVFDRRRDSHTLLLPSATLALVAVVGLSLDMLVRHAAGTGDRVRTSSVVTLYSGLLAAEPGSWCGGWTPGATQAALEDRDKSLQVAIVERIAARPAGHWFEVMQCKLTRVVLMPKPFALYWVIADLNENAVQPLSASDQRRLAFVTVLRPIEDGLYRGAELLSYIAAVAVSIANRRRLGAAALLPVAWLLSFWTVHLVFEAQERYFLATILLLPLLSALTRGLDDSREAGSEQVPIS